MNHWPKDNYNNARLVQQPGLDKTYNLPANACLEQHVNNEGKKFVVGGFTDLNSGDYVDFFVTTPVSGNPVTDLIFDYEGIQQTRLYFFEGAAYDPASAGVELVSICSNRILKTTSVNSIRVGAVLTTTGDLLFSSSKGKTAATPAAAGALSALATQRSFILDNDETIVSVYIQ